METRSVKMTLETAKRWKAMGGEYEQVALETFPELKEGDEWKDKFDGKKIGGFYVSQRSEIIDCGVGLVDIDYDRNLFKTEKHAKSALAYAQLTQLMALPEYNGDWVADWSDIKQEKWCIRRKDNDLEIDQLTYTYSQIALKSSDLAIAFKANNLDLIKQFNEL